MVRPGAFTAVAACIGFAHAVCPFMEDSASDLPAHHPQVRRDGPTDEFLSQFEVDDSNVIMTTNAGGPIDDLESLSAGERGPTLLEDFTFREKIMHFGIISFLLYASSADLPPRP